MVGTRWGLVLNYVCEMREGGRAGASQRSDTHIPVCLSVCLSVDLVTEMKSTHETSTSASMRITRLLEWNEKNLGLMIRLAIELLTCLCSGDPTARQASKHACMQHLRTGLRSPHRTSPSATRAEVRPRYLHLLTNPSPLTRHRKDRPRLASRPPGPGNPPAAATAARHWLPCSWPPLP